MDRPPGLARSLRAKPLTSGDPTIRSVYSDESSDVPIKNLPARWDDPRLVDGASATPWAFLPHGRIGTVMGLVARLATAGQLDALACLDQVFVTVDIAADRPTVLQFWVEADDETWRLFEPHAGIIRRVLDDLSGAPITWEIARVAPLMCGRFRDRFEVSVPGVAQALQGSSIGPAMARRAAAFRLRPRPGSGTQLVTVWDPASKEPGDFELQDVLFRTLRMNTTVAYTPGFQELATVIGPAEPETVDRPRLALVTSRGQRMLDDTLPHLDSVFDLTKRQIYVNRADAADQLAEMLRGFENARPPFDAVMIARGGGDPDDLRALNTEAVRAEITQLKNRGVFVVTAIGHGDIDIDMTANYQAKTPTSGAAVLGRLFGDLPKRLAIEQAAHARRMRTLRSVAEIRREVEEFSKNIDAIEGAMLAELGEHRQQSPARADLEAIL